MADIEPFHVVLVIARAKELEAQGRSIVNMVIGEPDFPTRRLVRDAAMRVLEAGHVHYTPSLGHPPLREAISGWYRTRYEARRARLAHRGDQRLVGRAAADHGCAARPGRAGADGRSGLSLQSPLRACDGGRGGRHSGRRADTAYQLTAELVEQHWTPRTKAVLVCSPSNPTGTMMPLQALREIHEVVRARGGVLISDEIYHGLTYGPAAPTARSSSPTNFRHQQLLQVLLHDRLASRAGWSCPSAFLVDVESWRGNLYISPPDVAQQAALAAFRPERVDGSWSSNRAAVPRAARLSVAGAARSWASAFRSRPRARSTSTPTASELTDDSYAFCLDVLEKAGVAIAPGTRLRRQRPAPVTSASPIPSRSRCWKRGSDGCAEYLGKMSAACPDAHAGLVYVHSLHGAGGGVAALAAARPSPQ